MMRLTKRQAIVIGVCCALAAIAWAWFLWTNPPGASNVTCTVAYYRTTYVESCTYENGEEHCDDIPETSPVYVCTVATATP